MTFFDFLTNPPDRPVLYPDPILRKPTESIREITDEIIAACKLMFNLMYKWNGVGLAAPQVGLSYKLFVCNPTGAKELAFINPTVVAASSSTCVVEEGCLSIPGVLANVERPRQIGITSLTLDGRTKKETFAGKTSRVVSHELDHLNCVLFIDRLPPDEKNRVLAILKE